MITKQLRTTIEAASHEAHKRRHEYVTLEHLLWSLLRDDNAREVLYHCGASLDRLEKRLVEFLDDRIQKLPAELDIEPIQTLMVQRVIEYALLQAAGSGQPEIHGGHVLAAMFQADRSHAVHFLKREGVSRLDVLNYLAHGVSKVDPSDPSMPGEGMLEEDAEDAAERRGNPLDQFTANLVKRAAEGGIDPLVGRGPEVERVVQVLLRRRKNNPILVGEPGVGKTAIAEGLALRIHEGNVPDLLRNTEVFALDMGAVLAGTKYRGQFEARFKGVIEALLEHGDAILFIDEIHTVVGAGSTSGSSMDASNILKPALSTGKLRCIGSTTYGEYKSALERDRALARRFQKIEIGEPTIEETVEILEGLKSYYEEHHGVRYTPEAIRLSAELAAKYLRDRHLPDKAIDVIDEAGARARMVPEDERVSTIDTPQIELVMARMAKIPPKTVGGTEKERLRELDEKLRAVIFGQDEAIDKLTAAIRMSRSGLGNPDKPVGSFLFSGPTGVGKTELSRQLAVVLGVEFIRFDMSEYSEAHTVSRLIGAPPGYVGFDQGGLLTEAIARTPYAVLVLDEIEKAHSNLFNILLQIMDHATLTDNNGRKADFRNVILIMTTNAGASELSGKGIGFSSEQGKGSARGAIERTFSPEFRNRLDAWIAFAPLDRASIRRVVDKFLDELSAQLAPKKVTIDVTDAAKEWLATHGFDSLNGARPMDRLIQQSIKTPLVQHILFGSLADGGKAVIDLRDDRIAIDV